MGYKANTMNKKKPQQIEKVKDCAVALQGEVLIKIHNYLEQKATISNNPEIKILQDCTEDWLDENYDYWNRILNYDQEEYKKLDEEYLKTPLITKIKRGLRKRK